MSNKFNVADMQGRIIVLSEKTSIILTLVFVLVALSALGLFGMAAYTYAQGFGLITSIPMIVGGLIATIYAFILHHLRKKGDMNVDKAVLPTISGGYVEVVKKTSIWITLAYVVAILGLLGALGVLGYGVYLYLAGGASVGIIFGGVIGSIVMLLYISVLGFLRTKIDFPLNNVVVRDTSGGLVELYKRKSIWLTLGMIITILIAVVFIGLGILAFTNTALLQGYLNSQVQMPITHYDQQQIDVNGLMMAGLAGAPAIITGLVMLVGAAVLNFLRVRGHVRPYNNRENVYVTSYSQPPQVHRNNAVGLNNLHNPESRNNNEEDYNQSG